MKKQLTLQKKRKKFFFFFQFSFDLNKNLVKQMFSIVVLRDEYFSWTSSRIENHDDEKIKESSMDVLKMLNYPWLAKKS